MSRIYVLGSIPNQGKTTMAVSLAKHFRSRGERVACMQIMKGQHDIGHYLNEGCYHYSLPLEALRSKETLAKWLPIGYDVHIIEAGFPYLPIGLACVSLFIICRLLVLNLRSLLKCIGDQESTILIKNQILLIRCQ